MKTIQELKSCIKKDSLAWADADNQLRINCRAQACQTFAENTALEKTMEYLRLYDMSFAPYISDDLMLAGGGGNFRLEEIEGLTGDGGHYCPNFEKLLSLGVCGLYQDIESRIPSSPSEEKTRTTYLETLQLFIKYMQKHKKLAEEKSVIAVGSQKENLLRMAADIDVICNQKPSTFLQGLQLLWFANCYIHLKPRTDTITFGNLDRTLHPLYQRDKQNNNLTPESAKKQICHFFLAFETMARDTQNIVLGGSDSTGQYFETDLTRLFLQAQAITRLEEPVLSLKIRPDTSDNVWDDAINLLSGGGGMPSFLNDPLYIEGLKQAGFSATEANTFANVGCYEGTPYGNTFGSTVTFIWRLAEEFVAFFRSCADYPSFESLLDGWHSHLTNQYIHKKLPFQKKQRYEELYHLSASTFSGCFIDGCVENLRLPEQEGAKNNILGINLGGLGTIVDSLLCIKHFVYDTKTWSLEFLKTQVLENYPDSSVLSAIRAFPYRFGSCEEFSVSLASQEATFLHTLIKSNPLSNTILSTPGLFIFSNDIMGTETLEATPDGRRKGDRYSYGASASELLPHRDITKVLLSSASLPLVLFPNGAPQTVNLMPELAQTDKGKQVIRTMVQTYFQEGGSHIHVNVANPDVLRDAQKNPQQYTDLLIRISGHTEPFIRLDKKMQDALIVRSQMGC